MPEIKLSRSQQGAETKRKLTEAALRLFAEKGYKNVSISDICGEVGVTVGVFYHYYKTKSDVFYVISAEGDEKIRSYRFSSENELDKIAELFHYYAEITEAIGKDAMSVVVTPVNGLIYTNNSAAKLALAMLEEGRKNGEITTTLTVEAQLKMLFAIIWGIICLWCQPDSGLDLVVDVDTAVRQAIDGLRCIDK